MTIIESVRGEYERYKKLAESAMAQIDEAQLSVAPSAESNSIAMICWHVSGNLKSRFKDFLTTDGEKPWRNRDEEFDARSVSRAELFAKWEDGWTTLWVALDELSDGSLTKQVTIRGQALSVMEALHRSLAHTSYHVGQIVYLAKEGAAARVDVAQHPEGAIGGVQPESHRSEAGRAHRAPRTQIGATAACLKGNRRRGKGRIGPARGNASRWRAALARLRDERWEKSQHR